ncbi:D-cysteine desulfhydrase family protein [Chitinophaga flava]|uniref:D-cysteine desulfhydrase n=1 Tax=Chitinophaga flava TaxID=2259036 RepID=A0A365XXF4_9BACT|nr:D-cysteine desulfhydrase family protein [Chitinophaga flava]RBL90691.1 D-cysteine desulfhydrase [Chitinophaga flava]
MKKNYLEHKYQAYPLIGNPTGIHALSNLNRQLKDVQVYLKRDDVMDIGLGGNKLRKLEYLIQDAISQGADTLLTTGGVQSNHARLTAAAAARAGMHCELVLSQPVPIDTLNYNNNGNILLEQIMGVTVQIIPKGATVQTFLDARCAELIAQGRKPYVMPMGGSNPVGCLGYANCYLEIMEQSQQMNMEFSHILVPNGSSGTHAGLLAGQKFAAQAGPEIRSYAVLADEAQTKRTTLEKTIATANLLGYTEMIHDTEVFVNDAYRGEGYGIPTSSMWSALRLLAQTEGIFLDPVYSGKAFAGMLGDIEQQKFPKGSNILFIMTGGTAGLFAYQDLVG